MACWALSHSKNIKNIDEKEKKNMLEVELEQEGIFPGLIKMRLFQEKWWTRLQELNSNSFEISFKWVWIGTRFGVVKNVENFGGAQESDERIYGQSLETKLEAEKERNYFASVFMGDSKIEEYLI